MTRKEETMLRKLLATIVACAALVIGPAAHAGTVSATARSQTSIPSGWYWICNSGDDRCVNNKGDHNTLGNPIIEYTKQNNGDEYWKTNLAGYVCDGESSCGGKHWPFTYGSGLNSFFDHNAVVTIQNYAYDKCVGDSASNYTDITFQNCSGSNAQGTHWVVGNSRASLVNVLASNTTFQSTGTCSNQSCARYMTAQGVNASQLLNQQYTSGYSFWLEYY
jgi:hypothetical protein